MRIIFYIFGFLIIFFGISFAMLNPGKVDIHYYVGSKEISLSILLALTLFAGVCLGVISMTFSWLKLKKANLALKHQLKYAKDI